MVASISAFPDVEYYLRLEHSLYHLKGLLGVGVWHGEGAHALGYRGMITPEQLRNAFAGLSPDGQTSLVQNQRGRCRQSAWDITFSAPKSVSVLWSMLNPTNRDKLERLLLRAVKRALDYLDSEALIARRGQQGNYIEHAKGVYALCPHGTSRAQDPNLHIHSLAINMCLREDLSTGAIRSWDLYCHKMAAGALFRVELSHLLAKELGLSISHDGWKFKIDGVPVALCEEQSKRRKQIESIAKEEGWTSARVLSQLAIMTRDPKELVPLETCFAHWKETSERHGFTRQVAEALLFSGQQGEEHTPIELSRSETVLGDVPHADTPIASNLCLEVETAAQKATQMETAHATMPLGQAFAESVAALAAFKAYFPERDLVRETAVRAQAAGVSATQVISTVKEGLDRFENRIQIQQSPYAYYSTKENVAAEKELLDRCSQSIHAVEHIATKESVANAIAKVERRLSKKLGLAVTLTADQRSSLAHITQQPGALKLVQGYAGTGKTQMLEAAHRAWKASELEVIGTTITGRASLGLQNATGIPSVTVEMLLRHLRPNLSVREAAELFAWKSATAIKAEFYEGKRAGRWLRNPWKEALREVAQGVSNAVSQATSSVPKLLSCRLTASTVLVVDEAAMLPTKTLLALKQECDAVGAKMVLIGDRLQLPPIEAGGPFWSLAQRFGCQSLTTIVRQKQEWMKEATALLIRDEPKQALELYAANGALHLARHQRAAVEKLVADYGKLQNADFSKAIALTATNDEACRINQGVQAKRKAQSQLGITSVRLPSGDRIFANDRIMLTLNDYSLGVRNGFLGTVVAIHRTRGLLGRPSLSIRLNDGQRRGFVFPKGRIITVDLSQYRDVQLGYAATAYKLQGVTVEKSFVLLGDAMLSKERAFTQLTRASHQTMLYGTEAKYGDSLKLLAQQISKVTQKDLAHDHTLLTQGLGYEQSQTL